MSKRWIIYLGVALVSIPVVVWLAFGPGVIGPYSVFTWPIARWFVVPDVLRDTALSAFVWFSVAIGLDSLVVAVARRHGAA